MKKLITKSWLTILAVFFVANVFAQKGYVVSGEIKDGTTGELLVGATVQIKGTINASATNAKGFFELKTAAELPFVLVFSFLGYETQEFEVKDLQQQISIALNTQPVLGKEVVVTASRIEEDIMKSPVTIDKLSLRELKESPASTFYDALENSKGVQMTTASLTFKVPNTRGFNVPNNFRFLQLVDGVDMQAATLGQSLGNAIGPTELDIESVEITPGAASALYGMNAINGMANMQTKSPFKYKGLSVYNRVGVNHINESGQSPAPMNDFAIRYATTFWNRIAIKGNFGYLTGLDWFANNNTLLDSKNVATDDNTNLNPQYPQLSGLNGIAADPVNSYGNETNISITDYTGKTYTVRRTGYQEKDLVDYRVKNIKADAAVHVKITEKLEASYTFRYGTLDGVFQRGNRIALRGVEIQSHKLELRSPDFFIRGYVNSENTGNSYNLKPTADNLEASFKSNTDWAKDYTTRLNTDLQSGNFDLASAQSDARSFADQGRFTPGTDAFNSQLNTIKNNNNWDVNPVVNGKMVNTFPGASTTGGSALWQKSRIYHAEGQYDFSKYTKKYVDVLVGADYRTYEIIPDGNNFVDFSRPISERNVALSDGTYGKNVYYTKYGAFAQVSRQFFDNKLKAVASLRYDKNLEFEGKWNPRVAVVFTPTPNHSIRASYQNGFRFPSLFEALSFVNNGGERRVGGLAEVNQGLGYLDNSYTKTSVDAFNAAVQTDLNAGYSRQQAALRQGSLLQRSPINAIQPERINSFEIGYKGIFLDNKLSADLDLYTNFYDNFINQVRVLVPTSGQIGGTDDLQTKYDMMSSSTRVAYRPYVNANQRYYSYGAALGLVYNFYQKYTVSGNVNYNNLIANDNPDVFIVAFNTPKWTYNLSIGNREIVKNLGFNVVWRWQQAFQWQNIFADGTVPAYGTLDAQVTYKIPKAYSTVKVGANNLLNNHYIQYIGGPTIGAIYYVAVTVDGLLTNALVK